MSPVLPGLLPGLPKTASCEAKASLPIQHPEATRPASSCRDWAGISYSDFVSLNTLLLCGILNPVPGVLVCAGDKLSFCSNYYRTVAGDTCASVGSLGRVVGLPAAGVTCAAPLPVDTEVCLAPTANQVRIQCCTPCGQRTALLLPRLLAHMRNVFNVMPGPELWCNP